MGRIIEILDLNPYQRVGGWHATLDDLENYVALLTFDVYAGDLCDPKGKRRWFCVPVSTVDGEGARRAAPHAEPQT